MAPAPATQAPGGTFLARSISKSSFLVPSPIRLREQGGNRAVVLGVGRRDVRGADNSSEGSRLVDEDMPTLWRRIREARAESTEEDDLGIDIDDYAGVHAGAGNALPAEWTELERRHHGSYVAFVHSAAGLLGALLLNTRPGFGAGLLAMMLLGVPASLFLVCAQLIQVADSVWSG